MSESFICPQCPIRKNGEYDADAEAIASNLSNRGVRCEGKPVDLFPKSSPFVVSETGYNADKTTIRCSIYDQLITSLGQEKALALLSGVLAVDNAFRAAI